MIPKILRKNSIYHSRKVSEDDFGKLNNRDKSEDGLLKRMDERIKKTDERVVGAIQFGCPFAHVGNAKHARTVLRDGGSEKMPAYGAFRRFAGRGIFTATGEEWEAKRAEVLKAFGEVGMEKLRDVAERRGEELVSELEEIVVVGEGDSDGVVTTMLPTLQRVALRITFEYLTGKSIEDAFREYLALVVRGGGDDDNVSSSSSSSSSSSNSRKNMNWKEIETEYLDSATILRRIIPARARSMWIVSDFLYYNFSSVGKQEHETIVKAKFLATLAVKTCAKDSALMKIMNGKAHMKRSSDPVDEATTLLFAGHDTQSATMCWGILELIKHEEVQDALRKSLQQRNNNNNTTAAAADYDNNNNNMINNNNIATSQGKPELEAVIRETLRLHPVAPLVVRQIKKQSVFLEKDLAIPKGAAACVWLHVAHRDPEAFKNPDSFMPSRWYSSDENVLRRLVKNDENKMNSSNEESEQQLTLIKPGQAYQPFASGSRSCVGQHIALATLRVVFGKLCEHFRFTESGLTKSIDSEMLPSAGFTVTPIHGCRVRISIAH